MALAQRKISKKKELMLVASLATIVIVTGLVAYLGLKKDPEYALEDFFAHEEIIPIESDVFLGIESLPKLINSSLFKRMQKFGDWPLKVEPMGKTNPFVLPRE
jgi:hypothetical protein